MAITITLNNDERAMVQAFLVNPRAERYTVVPAAITVARMCVATERHPSDVLTDLGVITKSDLADNDHDLIDRVRGAVELIEMGFDLTDTGTMMRGPQGPAGTEKYYDLVDRMNAVAERSRANQDYDSAANALADL